MKAIMLLFLLIELCSGLQMPCRLASPSPSHSRSVSPSASSLSYRCPSFVMQLDDMPPAGEEEEEEELNLTAKEKAQLMMRDPVFLVGLGVIGAALFGNN